MVEPARSESRNDIRNVGTGRDTSERGGIMKTGNLATWGACVVASFGVVALPVQAQKVGPANLAVGTARVIVPDGTSLVQTGVIPTDVRWFVFGVEPGKTYAVEVVDTDSDLSANTIASVGIFAADGTTTPPAETSVDCTANTRAPAVEVASGREALHCADVSADAGEHAEQAWGIRGGSVGDRAELPHSGAGEHDLRALVDQRV